MHEFKQFLHIYICIMCVCSVICKESVRSSRNVRWTRVNFASRFSRPAKYSVSVTSECAWRIDASKSTKGASKLRRDLINAEIANLRDLLPLPPSTRQRLSQLQLMALVCVFLRKANYFQQGKHQRINLIELFN